MNREERKALAVRIKAAMDANDVRREWLQSELADRGIRLSLKTISNIRAGNTVSSEETLVAMADILRITWKSDVEPTEEDKRFDHAVLKYQSAIGELLRAERELDAQVRRWATGEAIGELLTAAFERAELGLGRELTPIERLAIPGPEGIGRPSAVKVAEITAWTAYYDSREWTRYEMALIERVFPDLVGSDVTVGTHVDMAPFRDRVRRLGVPVDIDSASNLADHGGTTSEPSEGDRESSEELGNVERE